MNWDRLHLHSAKTEWTDRVHLAFARVSSDWINRDRLHLHHQGLNEQRQGPIFSFLVVCYLKEKWHKGANRPKKCRNGQICLLAGFILSCSINIHTEALFCFQSELLRVQSCWAFFFLFLFYKWRARKSQPLKYFILLPHIPVLLMTSLMQIAEHKMAVFTIMTLHMQK